MTTENRIMAALDERPHNTPELCWALRVSPANIYWICCVLRGQGTISRNDDRRWERMDCITVDMGG